MRVRLLSLALLSVFAVAACDGGAPQSKPARAAAGEHIAWREGDVDDAFAEARESGKPVLLYWGAVWCPPCNRLKAGLFQDPEFVARTRDFIPVYLDGDSSGAQAWGERFGVRGYPTLIVLTADRNEITRLSTGDPDKVETALKSVGQQRLPVKALVDLALKSPKRLKPDDWTVLAEYSWSQDEGQAAPVDQAAQTLDRLAAVAPTPALQRRFTLQSLAELPADAPALAPERRTRARDALTAVLASAEESRANREVLTYSGDHLVALASADAGERAKLSSAAIQAADRLYADTSLGLSDRLDVTNVDIALFKAASGKTATAPAALVDKVRARAAWADREAKTAYERQSVISTAADLLAEVGDKAAAEQLLKTELKKSKTPYYYMPSLADLAEARGDRAAAIQWLRQGYETAEGPATRVQWGVLYVDGLVRLAPHGKTAIETAAGQVIDELANQPDSYHQRTRQRFDTLDKALTAWSKANGGDAVLGRLRGKIAGVCGAQSDAKAQDACRNWLSVA